MSPYEYDIAEVTTTENIHKSFEKSISEKSPFMLFRVPGKEVELADLSDQTEFLIKPWNSEAFSIRTIRTFKKPSFPAETSKADYEEAFKKYVSAFQLGSVQKAILSAVILKEKPQDFDPVVFFFRLCESHPDAFTYLLYHPETGTWCGATPEILLEGKGDQFATVALAGTQSAKASKEYQWEEKEKEEQELVSQHIRNILKNSEVQEINESTPSTIQAAGVVHLKTAFQFKYSHEVKPLLNQLHPTPAVAGLPTEESIELIHATEKHDRGLYTGYIGILSEAETRVFVNLRCMQIGDKNLALYVGGGITAKSNMEAEWEETRLKAKTLLNLLKSST
jgi:isochorismate synthase